MDASEIKASLSTRGYSLSLIADAMERSPSLISKVVCRKATSIDVAKAIAKVIGKPLEEVFPDVPGYQRRLIPSRSETAEYQKVVKRLRTTISARD